MAASVWIAFLTLAVVLVIMVGEAVLSSRHEHALRARGAVEAPGDVFAVMRVIYLLCFVAMAIEGAIRGPAGRDVLAVGLAIFGLAKALKVWAISSLGMRWTFRVLVLPGAPLVTTGPYRWLRHPNYLAVLGELAGVALVVCAPVTGLLSIVAFGFLMWQRIRIEDRALGRQ